LVITVDFLVSLLKACGKVFPIINFVFNVYDYISYTCGMLTYVTFSYILNFFDMSVISLYAFVYFEFFLSFYGSTALRNLAAFSVS
jgi:hypothetical protein